MSSKALQSDLFYGDPLRDATSFRNDGALMALPFFTPGRTPVHEGIERSWVESDNRKYFIRNSPGEDGLPTIFDLDILCYLVTLLVTRLNRGDPVYPRISFTINDCLHSIRRGNGGREYDLFLQSLKRLKGTTVYTNVTSADLIEDSGWSWLQSFSLRKRTNSAGRDQMVACEVVICDWLFNAVVKEGRSLQLDADYFDLQGGLERRLYLIIRKHIGNKSSWWIGLDKLYVKTGSNSEFKRFAFEMRKMVEQNPFPAWDLKLSTDSRAPNMGGTVETPVKGRRTPLFLYVYRRDMTRLVPPVPIRGL
jgi:plasmid replication initiation protein